MNNILNEIKNEKLVAIGGHVRPDGDCVGSCMALYHYLKRNMEPDVRIDVFLENVPSRFAIVPDTDIIRQKSVDIIDCEKPMIYDVFISLDCGGLDRLGEAIPYFNGAKRKINIDHHISNPHFGDINHVITDASSTCEVLFDLFEEDRIDMVVAKALYLGIIHDTGVFKHPNTTEKTMNIAGKLINKGIPFSTMIDDTFYLKNYNQNKILGHALTKSTLLEEGKVIISYLTKAEMKEYGVEFSDLDGIIDQLRITEGVLVAVFIYETDADFKVSMRSNCDADVRKIAEEYQGGGHTKAAGCSIKGDIHWIIKEIVGKIAEQL